MNALIKTQVYASSYSPMAVLAAIWCIFRWAAACGGAIFRRGDAGGQRCFEIFHPKIADANVPDFALLLEL